MTIPHLRWWILCMLFLATVISYIDRQTMSLAAPVISKEFNLSNEQVGRILSSFLLAYAVGQLVAGRILDWIGARAGMAISIAVWSLANILTSLVTRPWGFSFFRFMLGVGEAGNFPGGIKVITEWFPARERAFAGGIFASGGSIGAIIAAPFVATLIHYWGWRVAFVATGAIGFVWLAIWLLIYDSLERHPMVSAKELAHIRDSDDYKDFQGKVRWLDLLGFRQVWALTIARFLEEPLFWLVLFWLPKYMVEVRGFSVLQTGWTLTIPFITLDLGYVGGGWLTGKLVARNWSIRSAKSLLMMCSGLLMLATVPALFSEDVTAFVLFLSLTTLGHGSWVSNMVTIPSDIAPSSKVVGSIYGISALGGGLGGMFFTEVTGIIADKYHSFVPVFVVSSFLPAIATLILILLSRRMEPIQLGPVREEILR